MAEEFDWNAEDELKKLESKYKLGSGNRDSDLADLERRNPEDRAQVLRDYDAQYKRRADSGHTGSGTDSTILTGGDGNIQSADPRQATSQYSSSSGGSGSSQLDALMAMLASDRERQQQERASMREILMGQLGSLQRPVDANDPALQGVFSANRLTSQREAERQRSAAAEQLGARGLGDSGAMDTTLLGIDERRAERNQAFEGNVMYQELQQRRQALNQLLMQAMAIGDSESARNIQAQLAAIQTQLNQGNFADSLAFQYTDLNSRNNLQALLALLNAA